MNAGTSKLVRTRHKVKAPLSKKHLIASLLDLKMIKKWLKI